MVDPAKHHFLVHTPMARPLLLLLDGHASHHNPQVLRIAGEEDINVFVCHPIPYISSSP